MRAIVFSGGGSRGAYHVGACRHLMGDLETPYEIVCGVSVGSLVAAFLAQYPAELSSEAHENLAEVFLPVETKDIHKKWRPFGFVSALWKSSALDSRPLRNLVCANLDVDAVRRHGRQLRVGAVNFRTGQYHSFSERTVDLRAAVLASSAFPGAYMPIKIGRDYWIDGGVRRSTPLDDAIDAGATHIDVVICAPKDPEHWHDRKPTMIEVGMRTAQLVLDEVSDLKTAELHNELIRAGRTVDPDKREISIRVIQPERKLPGSVLKFEPRVSLLTAERGYEDAREITGN